MEESSNPSLKEADKTKDNFRKLLEILAVVTIITIITLFATQSWKGDNGFPANPKYDFPFHAYRMWFAADHLQHLNFDFDFDYKSNVLFGRAQIVLPYLIAAPLVILFGLWQGISYYVILCYFLLGIGMYALGKTLKLSNGPSLFLSSAILLSYALVLESQFAGGLPRLFTYALFPWILVCYFKRDLKEAKLFLPILLGITILSHPLNAIYISIIIGALALFEFVTKSKNFFSSIGLVCMAVFFAFLLSMFFLGPYLLELNSGVLNTPNYLASISSNYFSKEIIAPIPELFFQRTFSFNYGENEHLYGYLGISLMLLSLIGLWHRRDLGIPLLILLFGFGIIIAAPTGIPTMLQAGHLSRPLTFMAFILAILAAIGLETLLECFSQKIKDLKRVKLIQLAIIGLVFFIFFVDLAPGLTIFPDGNYDQQGIRDYYHLFDNNSRVLFSQPYVGYGWSAYSKADFIQFTGETVNPEYYHFVFPLFLNFSEPEKTNKFFSLDIRAYIAIFSLQNSIKYSAFLFNSSRVFQPSRVIILRDWNLSYSEWLFEDVIKQQWYSPTKVGVLLPRVEVQENLVDYALVENAVKSNEITPNQLPLLFNATPEGKALPWRKTSTGETEILVDSPGWVFVSQMWYPHFRVNGKPLQEAGGGLSAFYADAPGVYTIYWKKPWYDYLFLTISITALIILGYLYFNQNILNKLNSE